MSGQLRGYLIEKYNNMGNAYTCRRLLEEARKAKIDLKMTGIFDCMLHEAETSRDPDRNFTKQGETGPEQPGEDAGILWREKDFYRPLAPADFIINRFKTGKIMEAINRQGTRSYNPLSAFSRYVSKYEQMLDLTSEAFVKPSYILAASLTPYHDLCHKLGSPFVAKGLESSMGREIFLIKNETDYLKLNEYSKSTLNPGKEWLFEEFIGSGAGKDMRLLSIRGKVIAAMERIAKDPAEFRSNVALGAAVRPLPVTEEFRMIARDLYRQTGLDIMGIDLLYGKELPCFCEINVMPGIEGMERASGINIAGKIIEMILDDFANR